MKKITIEEVKEKLANNDKDFAKCDLSGLDLSRTNLAGASLAEAETDFKFVQIAGIGSQKRMSTYVFDWDKVWCGCFIGTLKEFEIKVKETHKDDKQYLNEYLGFIKYVEMLKKLEN